MSDVLSARGMSWWQRNRLAATAPWFDALTAVLAIGYALPGVGYGNVSEKCANLLLLAALWMFARTDSRIRRSAPSWFLLAAILVPIASWALAHFTHPEWAERSPKVNRVTNWMLPVVVGFALGGNIRNTFVVWSAALAGLLAMPWFNGGFAQLLQGLGGARIDFKLHNAQHAAMYFAVALLGLISFLPRLLISASRRWLAFSLWSITTAFVALCIVLTQTRGVWLALLASLLVLAWMFALQLRRIHAWLTPALLLSFAALLLLLGQSQVVKSRVDSDSGTIMAALRGDLQNLPYDSPGIRLHTWADAVQWFAKRPLFGWGGNGRALVLEQTQRYPQWVRDITHHLHNSYLDTLVNYGMAGLVLLLSLWIWFVAAARTAFRHAAMPRDFYEFFIAFMVFWPIVNFFESYIYFSSGVFVFGLIGGGVLSRIWAYQLSCQPHPAGESHVRKS